MIKLRYAERVELASTRLTRIFQDLLIYMK